MKKTTLKIFRAVLFSATLLCSMNAFSSEGFKGSLVDQTKKALSGANIKIWSKPTGTINTNTNPKGFFNVELKPGKYSVRISKEGFEDKKVALLTITQGKWERMNIVLNKPGEKPKEPVKTTEQGITGIVTNKDKQPLDETEIKIWSKETGTTNSKTDIDGEIKIQLTPGTYSIVAKKTGFVEKKNQPILVVANQWKNFELVLDPVEKKAAPPAALQPVRNVPPQSVAIAGGGISGLVLNEKNKPIKDVDVSIWDGLSSTVTARTDKKGEFKKELSTGSFSLELSIAGYARKNYTTITVENGKWAKLRFMLERLQEQTTRQAIVETKEQGLELSVVDVNHNPLPESKIIISDKNNKSQQLQANVDGSIKIKMNSGAVFVNASKDEYAQSKKLKVNIKEGKWKKITITLEKTNEKQKGKQAQSSLSLGLILLGFLALSATALSGL